MIWQDIMLDRILTLTEIRYALTTIFLVKEDEIMIVKDIEKDIQNELGKDTRILCQTFISETEFPFSMTVYLRDHSLIPKKAVLEHDIDKIGLLCEVLDCRAMIGDSTLASSSWILIENRKNHKLVTIYDIEKYDNRLEYQALP